MPLHEGFFGGGSTKPEVVDLASSSESASTAQTTGAQTGQFANTSVYDPRQSAEFGNLLGLATNFAGAGGPDLSGSTNLLNQASAAGQGFAAGLPGAIAPAQNASNFALTDAINPGSNPALQQYIQLANDQLSRQFQQTVIPTLKGNAVQAGNVGSSRAGIAEGLASQGLLDAQGRQTAQLESQGYSQGLQAMLQALGLAPQTIGLGGLEAGALGDAATLTNLAETGQYNADATGLQLFRDLISGNLGGTTTGAGTSAGASSGTSATNTVSEGVNQTLVPQQPQGASPFQNALGLASAGASIYGALNPAAPIALNVLGGR